MRKEWWNRIAYLNVLLRAITLEEVIVRKSLKSCRLPYGQTPTLDRVRMDKDRFRRDLGGVEEAYREVCRRVTGA